VLEGRGTGQALGGVHAQQALRAPRWRTIAAGNGECYLRGCTFMKESSFFAMMPLYLRKM
jgi:hypothetical protein